ncbi:MAG: aspartate aminotransferase family protein [Gammaproteobacteria bacterium]|nr:aspartate aminotransferase family protein [Pseudomonadales bacterium]MCP5345771.1 aspartate aminotransferase family protein [Pseudomonadales bacterium]
MNCIETDNNYAIQFSDRQNLIIDRGFGTEVWDPLGGRYLDFTSGWGVSCLGHGNPVIIDALISQASRVMQNPNSGFTYSPSRSRLLEVLQPLLPGNLARLFFVNSGAEANDLALKLARKISGRKRVVSTLGSFHGRTFNTLSVTGGPENQRRFSSESPATDFVRYGEFSALVKAVSDETAAVILEPVQGEGGVRLPPPGYLERVTELCRKKSIFLIIDEIQTGFCRTGKMFAIEHGGAAIRPDFMTMGKGLAGGFPMAALAVTGQVAEQIQKGDHGGTFCGNPLGCAVAAAVVDFLAANQIGEQVTSRGVELLAGLNALRRSFPGLIREARGTGLLTAIELVAEDQVWELTRHCQEQGLLVTPTRNGIVRLIPDLLVSSQHISEALSILEGALQRLGSRVAAASPAGIDCGSHFRFGGDNNEKYPSTAGQAAGR